MIPEAEQSNYGTFRDCLSDALIQSLTVAEPKQRKRAKAVGGKAKAGKAKVGKRKSVNGHAAEAKTERDDAVTDAPVADAEELGDFIEYLASEIFTSLQEDLRTLSFSATQRDPALTSKYSTPLPTPQVEDLLNTVPPSALESLSIYIPPTSSIPNYLSNILESYIQSNTAPPPIWITTRASACELCARPHIPLTYHHLIPRSTHSKVLKRGWREEWELNKVAWLCRACHSFVHRVASNEELAREFDTVEKLMEREDVRGFVGWVGGVRWKAR